MSTVWIRVIFGVVLALVVLFTVQFGVAMALPGPQAPGDPEITFRQLTNNENESGQNTLTASIDRYYDDAQDYRDDYVDYQRNLFLAGVGLAALLAIIGLVLPTAVNYLRFGLLLGAGLAMVWVLYASTRAVPNPAPAANSILALLAAGEPKQLDFAGRFLRFALSFVSLILLLFLGLWRLTEWPASTKRAVVTAPTAVAPTTPVISQAAAAWAPPASEVAPPPPMVTETTTVVSETPTPRTEPPSSTGEGGRWQRPADAGETARTPDPSA